MGQGFLRFLSLTEVWVGGLGLSAFLAIFWVLRGAPIGQAVKDEEPEDAPQGGYRDRVIAAIAIGLVLNLFGAYLALSRGVVWSIPAFVLGFGTVLSLTLINQRHRHSSPTMRRTVGLATGALNASLLAGILIIVNVVTFRYGGKAIDLTSEGAYSISSLTTNQLRTLKSSVTFTTFFGRSRIAAQQFDRVQQLLELYKSTNPARIKLDHIDPFRDLGRYDELVKRVPDIEVTQGGGVLIEYGEGSSADRMVVRNADLFETPAAAAFDPNAEQFESIFKGEDALTSALMQLREAKKPKIVFLTGHGELPLDDTSSNSGLGRWRGRLLATGFDVRSLDLLVTREIPDDTSLVIIAGSKTPFKPDELSRLKAYTDRKGPLLITIGDVETTGLEPLLKSFGVDFGRGIILEPRLNYRTPWVLVLPITSQTHPILESLNGQGIVFPRPTPFRINPASSPGSTSEASAYVHAPLLKSSPQSWSKTDLVPSRFDKEGKDETGPFLVGVAINDKPAQGQTSPGDPRVVLYSCRYVGENGMVQLDPTNLDLLMNTVNWLRGRGELAGISPKRHYSLTLNADPLMRMRLILVPTVMSFLLILALGVTTYLARRH